VPRCGGGRGSRARSGRCAWSRRASPRRLPPRPPAPRPSPRSDPSFPQVGRFFSPLPVKRGEGAEPSKRSEDGEAGEGQSSALAIRPSSSSPSSPVRHLLPASAGRRKKEDKKNLSPLQKPAG